MNRLVKVGLPAVLAAGILVGAAAFAVLGQVGTPKVANAQTPTNEPRTNIGVSGTGKVNVSPDTAVASIGVEITAPTLEEATAQASELMTKVLDAIKAQGVDAKDIQTTSYNVYPLTDNPKEGESPKVTAYRVSNLVTVKIRNIENVGAVLDAALGAGANSINSVFFTVDDPTAAQEEARTAAVKDAMAKAQSLAAAAGVEVGNIISISELASPVIPFYRGAFDAMSVPAAGGAGPVETGSTEISVTVEMHFEIAQ
jgi:uncharacterized protein YggE